MEGGFSDTGGNHARARGMPMADEKAVIGMTLEHNFLTGLESGVSSGAAEG